MDIAALTMTIGTIVAMLRDPIFGSDAGVELGRDLVWSNRLGSFDRVERAAFIVDHGDGDLECVLWPQTFEHERASFSGTVPPGTVAIIHTHPNNCPWPSLNDQHEAQRLGIAIYALTPLTVIKALPSQKTPVLVYKGTWIDPPPRGHVCRPLSDRN